AEFRERSEQRIADLRRAGTTLLIVSHNSATLRRMCDRIGWLAYGRLQMLGDTADVIGAYEGGLRNLADSADQEAPTLHNAKHAVPLAVDLHADQTLFVLETPSTTATAPIALIEAQSNVAHIAPFRQRADLPQGARSALAAYRLVRGTFFYDQMAQLLD